MDATNKDALQLESEVLDHFIGMVNPKDKKIVALAKKLLPTYTHPIQQRLLLDIVHHKTPLKLVQRVIDLIGTISDLIPKFIEQGYHALIITDDEIHPAKIDAPAHWLVPDKKWSPEEEREIQFKVLGKFVEEYELPSAIAKVMLMPEFGFSGIPSVIEAKYEKDLA